MDAISPHRMARPGLSSQAKPEEDLCYLAPPTAGGKKSSSYLPSALGITLLRNSPRPACALQVPHLSSASSKSGSGGKTPSTCWTRLPAGGGVKRGRSHCKLLHRRAVFKSLTGRSWPPGLRFPLPVLLAR